jgi:hypothetical protein
MLRFYYTTSEGQDAIQDRSYLSVGGFKAQNLVPNEELGNLFNEVTPITIKENRYQYIGLMLKNESADDYVDVLLGIQYPDNCYSDIQIAVVDLATDAEGYRYMERVDNMYSRPYVGDFADIEITEEAPDGVNIGDLTAGEMVGIWFRRKLDLETIKVDQIPYEVDVLPRYRERELPTEDEISLIMKYEIYVEPVEDDDDDSDDSSS